MPNRTWRATRRSRRTTGSRSAYQTSARSGRTRSHPAVGEQEVVALGDHQPGRRSDDGRRRERLLEVALEARRVHRAVGRAQHPLQRRDVAVDVERRRRPLAVAQAQPVELDVGEVEAVHRQGSDPVAAQARRRVGREVLEQRAGEGALAGARRAGDPQRPPLPVAGDEVAGPGDQGR
ncbi:hypothetical protein [Nocardioides sp. TF02-7]|uniref:hypothetical protein n=1 Tax=Nocardioides sp. TF02-7 TaxID=2917724 RepID=UPI001F068D29|nr:hypothetical protein [Nocardioides sp. TF02-7]UMG91374.1 hypothetical protein MF408_14570 [Nocardioides sp. TF02-7]